MTSIAAETQIAAPKEKVWKILADLGDVARFHPFVTKSYYDTGSCFEGVGASRVCEFGSDMTVRETAREWRQGEWYVLGIEVLKGMKPPIQNFRGHLSVREATGGCIARIEMSYTPTLGPLGWLMDRLMIRPQYAKMLPGIAAGLKHYAETGEPVDVGVLKRISRAMAVGATTA